MADFGIFEAAISSEAEVGLARQAAIDSLSAAIYDVREKLGPALFAASSLEEFRDRVAMMKNDQSLFKIISAHTPPVTGTVRRIVGKNSVLEKEFKAKLAARPSEGDWDRIMDQPAPSHWQKILDDQDAREKSHAEDWKRSEQMENANREWQDSVRGKERNEYGDIVGRRRQSAPNDQFVNDPAGPAGTGSVGAPTPTGGSIDTDPTNNGGRGSFAETGKFPTQVTSRRTACYPGCEKNEAHAKKFHKDKEARRRQAGRLDTLQGILDNHQAQKIDGMLVDAQTANLLLQLHSKGNDKTKNTIETAPLDKVVNVAWGLTKKGEFSGTQNLDQTFKPSDDELIPEDNFDGYLDSVDQGAPAAVERNFTSAVLYRDWCEARGLSPIRLSSLDAYADRLSDADYMRLASQIQAWERQAGYPATSPGAKLLKEKTKNSPEVWNEDEGWTDHSPKTPKGQSKDKLKDVTAAKKCKGCGKSIDPLEEFPGGKCLDCHAGDPAVQNDINNMTADDLANMWGADVLRKHKGSVDPMRAYINWCQANNLTRVSARNVAHFAGNDVRLCIHLAQRMRNAIRTAAQRQAVADDGQWLYDHLNPSNPDFGGYGSHWTHSKGKKGEDGSEREVGLKDARRRHAAPDYLQKADDALTQLLNQKAQEFQETIAPLQQALVTVQQAEQLQQQANPLNVLPPPGTVNVLPGQAAPGQVGQPDPSGGADPSAAAAAALAPPPSDPGQAGLGAAPGGGVPTDQSGPPPAAGPEGALPPELMQATARRRGGQGKGRPPTGGHRTANGSVFDLWERWKSDPNYTQRGGEPDYEAFAKAYNVGERAITKLRQQHASVRAVNRYIAWCTRRGLRAADKKVMTGYHNKVGAAERRRLAAALRRIATEDNDPYGGGFNPNSDPSQRPPSNSVGKGGTPPPVETPPPNPMPNIVPPGPAQVGPWPVYGAPGNNTAGDIPGMIGLPTVPGMGFQPHASRRTARPAYPFKGPIEPEEISSRAWADKAYADAPSFEDFAASQQDNQDQMSWDLMGLDKRKPSFHPGEHLTAGKEPVNIAEEAATNQWRKMDSALSAKGYKYDKASKHWTKPGARPVKNHWQIKGSWNRLADYLNTRQRRASEGDLLKAEGDEISTIGEYTDFADKARAQGNDAAANTFDDIISDEREHVQKFDDQLDRVAHHKQAWTGWGPSVFPKTRQVDGWEWNERLAGYTSGVPQRFSCHCGSLFDAPGGYHKCGCGKTWNSYVIGQGGPSHTASADLYIVREIPVRPGVIVASHGSLDAGPEVSELSGVEFRSGKRTAREDSSPSRGQERVSLRLSERREAGNGSSLPHSRSRSADVPGIAEGGGGDSPSQRQSARQPARESGLRDQGRQHAGHDPARHTVAAGQDALPIRSSAGSTESGATPTEVGLAFLSGVRAGTQASGEAPRVGFSNRGESVLPTDHDYIASIYKLTDPGELDGEGDDPGTPKLKATTPDWHRRDKNQRWTKAAGRG